MALEYKVTAERVMVLNSGVVGTSSAKVSAERVMVLRSISEISGRRRNTFIP